MLYQFLGIDHVQVAAPTGCEHEARTFYAEKLGMIEIAKPALLRDRGGVWFQCGTNQMHIGVQQDFVPARKAHPAFHVQNLADFRKHLTGQNVKFQDDDALESADRFFVHDPFGNRIEFLEWL